MSDNGYYDITFNKLDSSFNFLYSNYSLKNRELVLNNVSFNDFNNTSNIENQNILLNNSINLVNSYLYHKNINNKSINVTLTKNILKNNLLLTLQIYPNNSNLVNKSIDKDKHSVVLFNGTLHNQNQYNKTFKLLSLNHSINDNISKELNNSKSNNSICDDSREDNFLINPVPESDNKDYNIMFLIPLLVLLGAIILYKKKIR